MTKTSKTIVFFGSGPVAAASLALLAKTACIEAVITKPRPAHHRGSVPVLDMAAQLGVPTYTAHNRQSLDELFEKLTLQSQGAVLIDFGIIVSQNIIDAFPLGIINSHFSILPEWRGADPISYAILSGQKQTGVSLMMLVQAMDEGPLLGYGTCDILPTTTTPELTNALIELSNSLLSDELPRFLAGASVPAPQSITGKSVSYSRKLTKEDGIIDWHKPAEHIEREIRAFTEWPKSRTTIANKDVVITSARVIEEQNSVGSFIVRGKMLLVGCGEKSLAIDALKPSGKNEMTAAAFLAGYGHLLKRETN